MLLILLFTVGCATIPRTAPVTQSDIISMTKAGLTDDEIIQRIAASGAFYRLQSEDIIRLRKEGVSDRVLNFMIDSYTRAVIEEQRRRDYEWRWYAGYGWPHYYW